MAEELKPGHISGRKRKKFVSLKKKPVTPKRTSVFDGIEIRTDPSLPPGTIYIGSNLFEENRVAFLAEERIALSLHRPESFINGSITGV